MKVSGFSFIRDGVRLGYPFVESLRSALPVCDEFVIAVGKSDDGTLERLQALNEPKLRIIETTLAKGCAATQSLNAIKCNAGPVNTGASCFDTSLGFCQLRL